MQTGNILIVWAHVECSRQNFTTWYVLSRSVCQSVFQ